MVSNRTKVVDNRTKEVVYNNENIKTHNEKQQQRQKEVPNTHKDNKLNRCSELSGKSFRLSL